MFETLLESKARSERSTVGVLASIGAHAAITAAAVLATAQAGLHTPITPDVVHRFYFPPAPTLPPTQTLSEPRKGLRGQLPTPIEIRRIDLKLPSIDVTTPPMTPLDIPSSPDGALTGENRANSESSPGAPFHADQVDKPAAFISGSATPRYPDVLRSSGVEGKVVAVFVVDAAGRAETDSVRLLRSDNVLFEDAVRAVLPRMRFLPAEIGGRRVRQLVQMPFVFTIDR